MIQRIFQFRARFLLLVVLGLALSSVGKTGFASETETFILIENRSEFVAKVAAPGAKPVRVKPGDRHFKLTLTPEDPNGVDVKAWWVTNPRQLCVIFVRYGGTAVIAGDENIKCLGN